jgi:hypothetical protein
MPDGLSRGLWFYGAHEQVSDLGELLRNGIDHLSSSSNRSCGCSERRRARSRRALINGTDTATTAPDTTLMIATGSATPKL